MDASDVQDWCRRFDSSEEELMAAVYAVGGHPDQLKTVFRVSLGERLEVWFRLGRRGACRH